MLNTFENRHHIFLFSSACMVLLFRDCLDAQLMKLRSYRGFISSQKEAGIPKKLIKVEDIPGLRKFSVSSRSSSRVNCMLLTSNSSTSHSLYCLYLPRFIFCI